MTTSEWRLTASVLTSIGAGFVLPSLAWAQPAAVDAHAEDVAATPAPAEEGEDTDVTSWGISAGAVLNTGNTENFTLNAGSRFRLVRLPHAVEAEVNYILGLSDAGFSEKKAENLNLRMRYDFFIDALNALFIAGKLRQDDFAGLSPRLQGQVGYLRNVIYESEGKNRFWTEIGYDITFDNFNYGRLNLDPMMYPNPPADQVTHSARLFLGYENTVDDGLAFRTGFELLFNLDPNVVLSETQPDGTVVERVGFEDVRFNWENALRVNIVGSLLAELKFTMQFDNVPAAGASKLDTITQLNLVYSIL